MVDVHASAAFFGSGIHIPDIPMGQIPEGGYKIYQDHFDLHLLFFLAESHPERDLIHCL